MAFLKRQTKGGFWSIVWKENGVQKWQKVSKNKGIAEAALKRWEERASWARGGLGILDLPLEEWQDRHLERLEGRVAAGDLAASTLQRTREALPHFIAWLREDRPEISGIAQLSLDVLRSYQLARVHKRPGLWRRKAKGRTVNTEMLLLSPAFKAAVRDGILLRSPMDGIRHLKEKDSVPAMELRPGEVRKILKAADPWVQPYLVGYAFTGARRGELFKVTWSDVSFKPGTVRLQNLKTHRDARDRDRQIPMHAELRKILKERRNLERPWPAVPAENLRRAFKAAVKEAGLPRHTRIHDLRHAFAGSLVSAGTDLYVVGKLLGHRDAEDTRRYAHLAPEALKRAVARLRF
jgi:integrase